MKSLFSPLAPNSYLADFGLPSNFQIILPVSGSSPYTQPFPAGQVALPDQLPSVLVQANKAGGLGERDVDVVLVHPVGRGHVQQVADDERGAVGHVVREHVELVDQADGPD